MPEKLFWKQIRISSGPIINLKNSAFPPSPTSIIKDQSRVSEMVVSCCTWQTNSVVANICSLLSWHRTLFFFSSAAKSSEKNYKNIQQRYKKKQLVSHAGLMRGFVTSGPNRASSWILYINAHMRTTGHLNIPRPAACYALFCMRDGLTRFSGGGIGNIKMEEGGDKIKKKVRAYRLGQEGAPMSCVAADSQPPPPYGDRVSSPQRISVRKPKIQNYHTGHRSTNS